MKTFLENTILGSLEILEVYEYFDRPLLFTCRNEIGFLYIVTLISDEYDEEVWLIAPMSQNRFEQVRSGAIDLYSSFKKAEIPFLFKAFVPINDRDKVRIQNISTVDLLADQLPEPGEFLELSTQTLPQLVSPTERAIQSRREQVDLGLETTIPERTEAPAHRLGTILSSFQKFINTVGNAKFGKGSTKGAISQDIISDMQLNVVGYSAGSFETNMASASAANLFNDTKISDVITEVLNLIHIVEDKRALHARLMDLGSRVASAYVEFLETISIIDVSSLEINWRSPHPEKGGSASITSYIAQETAKTIKSYEEHASRELEIAGVLIGANLRTMKFELEVEDSNIAGDIDDVAKDTVNGAVLGQVYRVRIREVEIFKPMIEESAIRFILLHLQDTTSRTDE